MAIAHILKSRKYREKLLKVRRYGPVEKEEMTENMKHLEKEFNHLRDK
jgi:hypothetical protein